MPAPPQGAGRADLEQAIALLRARVEEEFRISERLDTKSRQAFTLAAGFFVVAQSVALASFSETAIDTTQRVFLGIAAVLAILGVACTAYLLANGEELLEEDDVRPNAVVQWCDDATDDDYVSVRIVGNLRDIATSRRHNNEIRGRHTDRVAAAMRWTVILSTVELLIAFLVRM